MGLLDDYGLNMDEIETNSFDVPDNIYNFTLADIDVFEKDGRESIRFHYDLLDDNEKSFKTTEWFNLPEDSANLTEANKVALSRLKSRVLSLGVPEADANKVSNDDLVGAYGTLQLVSSKGKNGKTYQNVRNLRVDPEWQAAEPEPEPEPVKKTRAPRSAKVTTKPNVDDDLDAHLASVGATAKAAPAVDPEPEPVDDIKARIAAKRAARMAAANTSGVRANPFGTDDAE